VKTVLFAWELGRGLGHLMNMRRISARLKPHGFRCVAVTRDSAAADLLGEAFGEIIAAPQWPNRSATSSTTLNDILSALGLADTEAVRRLLNAWDEIFKRTQPDLVIADFSPIAALAARNRIPLVHIGNGYTLPPHQMNRFPPLHRFSPPAWNEEQTLAAVNQAAQACGRVPLDRLPQLFSGDACRVQTFPLFDPYDTQRTEPLDGPIFDRAPATKGAGAQQIFAYLSSGYALHPSLFAALRPFAARLRLQAQGLPMAQVEELRRAGARIDTRPAPLAEILPATCLIVHNGGPGVSAEALVAGVPQLVLSAQVEQDFNGRALKNAGVAEFLRIYDPGVEISPELIGMMSTDDALAARAATQAERHRAYLATTDALRTCERTCLQLLTG
jgi:UDP:flavonoid glycosyltransferase YjiC (YdhE family)